MRGKKCAYKRRCTPVFFGQSSDLTHRASLPTELSVYPVQLGCIFALSSNAPRYALHLRLGGLSTVRTVTLTVCSSYCISSVTLWYALQLYLGGTSTVRTVTLKVCSPKLYWYFVICDLLYPLSDFIFIVYLPYSTVWHFVLCVYYYPLYYKSL